MCEDTDVLFSPADAARASFCNNMSPKNVVFKKICKDKSVSGASVFRFIHHRLKTCQVVGCSQDTQDEIRRIKSVNVSKRLSSRRTDGQKVKVIDRFTLLRSLCLKYSNKTCLSFESTVT